MKLQAKIKRDIERHALMACHDLDEALASIDGVDFNAFADDDNQDAPSYTVKDGVASIKVRGLLVPKTAGDYREWGVTSYEQIGQYIDQANSDYLVNSIELDIDSGGGYVAGLDDVTETIYQSAKPVSTYVSGDMYSAAYWLGASANKITASKSAGVGSIGVYVIHSERSKALEKSGYTFSLFRSGKFKAAFNSFMPLSADEKKYLQDGVDVSASAFFNHVAARRNITAATVESWNGVTFSAAEAKEQNLIDEIIDGNAVKQSGQAQQSNTNQNPITEGANMDLQEAQAKIEALEAEKAIQAQAIADAKAEALAAQNALAEAQAAERKEAISKLAAATKREFDEAQIAAFVAMDKAAFDTVAALMQPSKPELPQGLDQPQAEQGRDEKASKILARVAELNKAKGAK